MPTYVTLLKWTDQGIRTVKESPQRLDAAKEAIRAAGGRLTAFYLLMGEYDMMVISEAPNDEAYTTSMLALGARGAVRSTTLKAFTEEEYRRIIAAIS